MPERMENQISRSNAVEGRGPSGVQAVGELILNYNRNLPHSRSESRLLGNGDSTQERGALDEKKGKTKKTKKQPKQTKAPLSPRKIALTPRKEKKEEKKTKKSSKSKKQKKKEAQSPDKPKRKPKSKKGIIKRKTSTRFSSFCDLRD